MTTALPFNPMEEFPQLPAGRLHLNHSGISPLPKRAAQSMQQYAAEAAEKMGTVNANWYARLDETRRRAAKIINAHEDEIAFTKNTTDGLLIVANSINWQSGQCVIVEETTFPANWYTWKNLEREKGIRVLVWPERNFAYQLEDLEELLRNNPVQMVSLSAVDYATGFRHDLEAAGRLCREHGAMFCIDGIQAVGACPVDVAACGADFLSADSHKWMLGPEGAGFLFVRKERLDELNENMCGWIGRVDFTNYEARDLQPTPSARRFEPGAHNHGGLQAMSASLAMLLETGSELIFRRIQENIGVLRDGLASDGWECVSPENEASASGIISFRRDGADINRLSKELIRNSIICYPRRGFLRLAPHFYQSPEHMQRVVETVKACHSS